MINQISSFLKETFAHALGTAGAFLGAAILGFVVVIIGIWAMPTKQPGDLIAEKAKEHFVGQVVGVDGSSTLVALYLETDNGPRVVRLDEIRLIPELTPQLAWWHAKAVAVIKEKVLGQLVEVYASHAPAAGGVPSYAQVVYRGNYWLNGELAEEGLCYAARTEPTLELVGRALVDIERTARLKKRGSWEIVTRDQFMSFYAHY